MHGTIVPAYILYHRLHEKSNISTDPIGRLTLNEYSFHAADASAGGFFFGDFESFATFG